MRRESLITHVYGLGDKEMTELVRDALVYYFQILLPRRAKPLEVTVQFEDSVVNDEHGKVFGECEFTTRDEFVIRISKSLNKSRMVLFTTLAHECVHVKQFTKGEWSFNSAVSKWMSKPVNEKRVSYWDQPWEIDAHGRERGLVHRWIKARKLNKKFEVRHERSA